MRSQVICQARNQLTISGPICFDDYGEYAWTPDCSFDAAGKGLEPQDDIIATIPPDLMAALADGMVQALIDVTAQVEADHDALWSGNDSDKVSLDIAMTELNTALKAIKPRPAP